MSAPILLSWKELTALKVEEPPFLCHPFVPEGGVVLLHGKWSVGKSPLTWHLAACVGEGKDFFGFPCRRSRVLYLEVDTPLPLVKDRTDKLEPAENVWFGFLPPFIMHLPPKEREGILAPMKSVRPDLVIVNTLRKVHQLDDKESSTPSTVYGTFQRWFPGAALLFVHHDVKDHADPKMRKRGEEAFSGSQHWADDAQVCLHLVRHGGQKNVLRLEHTKSQVSETMEPIVLELREGSFLSIFGEGRKKVLQDVQATVGNGWESLTPPPSKGGIDKEVAERLGVSERTARRIRASTMRQDPPANQPAE